MHTHRVGSLFAPLLLAVALPAPAAAQAPDAPWANKLFLPGVLNNPALTPPPAVAKDFGTVPQGTVCTHTFTLANVYDVPMQVTDVRKSCGCLEAFPPQKVLLPGESAEFVVTMNTAKFSGPNTQTLYVTVGPNYVSTAVLRLTANSRSDVLLQPGAAHFGTVAAGSRPAPVTVTLEYNGRQKDWKVTGVVPTAGPVEVTVKEAGRTWFGPTKYAVTVALKPDAPAGPLNEVVSLKTNDPGAPVVTLPVTGTVQAPLTLDPAGVRFDRVPVGTEVERRVLVRAATPFRVQPLTDAGDGVSVDTFPAPGPVQIVTVKFKPTKAGAVRRDVRLVTDLPGGAWVALPVEAEAVE